MIEGKLVNLRARETSDLERMARWDNDREATRFLVRRYPRSEADSRARLEREAGQMMSYADVGFAIETKDGRHIGYCDLAAVPEDRKARLGIMIGEKDLWSRGFGTDAMLTLMRFGFDEMNLNKIALTVLDDNARGIACYETCGFIDEGRERQACYLEGTYHDLVHMSVLREEFYAREAVSAKQREEAVR